MTTAWTSNTVPGSLTVTGASADAAGSQSTSGRCPRCERRRSEMACPGVPGELTHLGS